jgi:cytochrome c oxidase subunit 4
MKGTLFLPGLLIVWLLLHLLLALTVTSAYFALGVVNIMINLFVATAQAWLVMVLFMQLHTGSITVRLVASAGLLWLVLLITLSLADNLTRLPVPAPW